MMMTRARIERLKNDHHRLQELCAQSRGRIAIKSVTGTPPTTYVVEFTGKMLGPSATGPHGVRRTASFRITLPPNYPDPGAVPNVVSIGPIWHPHFFGSGQLCTGNTHPTLLDAFVTWLWQAIVLDPRVNSGSAANGVAKSWQTANAERLPLDTPDVRVPAGSVPVVAEVQPAKVPAPAVAVSAPRIRLRDAGDPAPSVTRAPEPVVATPRIHFRDAGDPAPSVTRAPVPLTARISWR